MSIYNLISNKQSGQMESSTQAFTQRQTISTISNDLNSSVVSSVLQSKSQISRKMNKIRPRKLNFSMDLNNHEHNYQSKNRRRKSSSASKYPFSKDGMNKMGQQLRKQTQQLRKQTQQLRKQIKQLSKQIKDMELKKDLISQKQGKYPQIQHPQVPYLHQSTITITMGALTALFAKYTFGEGLEFSGEIFFTIILPPIIFSAGYSLRKSLFFENFGIITFLGAIGTIIAFALLSLILQFLNHFIFKTLTLSQILMVSSVLCATGTEAAMSLIKPQKYPVLNAVLFGEDIINDAVAILLYEEGDKLYFIDSFIKNFFPFFLPLELIEKFFNMPFGILKFSRLANLFNIISNIEDSNI